MESSQDPRINNKSSGLVDWSCFLPTLSNVFLLIIFILSLVLNGVMQPVTRRGFFCNDPSIQYPIKTDTVSFKWLLVIALFIPSLVIRLLERKMSMLLDGFAYKSSSRCRRPSNVWLEVQEEEDEQLMSATTSNESSTPKRQLVINNGSESDLDDVERNRPTSRQLNGNNDDIAASKPAIAYGIGERVSMNETSSGEEVNFRSKDWKSDEKTFSDLQLFVFGFIATMFLTGVGKTTCGNFRPHFMARCKPDIDCNLPENLHRYIENFKCTDKTLRPRDFFYITTSWPSGHSSVIFFSMFYLIFYLETIIPTLVRVKLTRKSSSVKLNPLFLYSLYVLLIGLAAYISLTRITDYHHHPLDVLTGASLGAVIAILIAKYVLQSRYRWIRSGWLFSSTPKRLKVPCEATTS